MSEIIQSRIRLQKLKVTKLASRNSLCFTATVLFDGAEIADAENFGRGGQTAIRPLKGKQQQLKDAAAFAKTLPAETTDFPDSENPPRNFVLPMTLESLVDHLAHNESVDRSFRTAFKRDLRIKIMYVTSEGLMFVANVNRSKCTPQQIVAHHARIRRKHGADTRILSEMPIDAAFALWKQTTVRVGSRLLRAILPV